MKKYLFIILIAFVACSEEEPESDQGCLTGIRKGTNYRVTIRCSTHQQFLAGNNTHAGGTSNWSDYEDHQWAKCSACN
jgi:hypothetical protein